MWNNGFICECFYQKYGNNQKKIYRIKVKSPFTSAPTAFGIRFVHFIMPCCQLDCEWHYGCQTVRFAEINRVDTFFSISGNVMLSLSHRYGALAFPILFFVSLVSALLAYHQASFQNAWSKFQQWQESSLEKILHSWRCGNHQNILSPAVWDDNGQSLFDIWAWLNKKDPNKLRGSEHHEMFTVFSQHTAQNEIRSLNFASKVTVELLLLFANWLEGCDHPFPRTTHINKAAFLKQWY